jgi:hypothetical protein
MAYQDHYDRYEEAYHPLTHHHVFGIATIMTRYDPVVVMLSDS